MGRCNSASGCLQRDPRAKQQQQLVYSNDEVGRRIVRSAHIRPASLSANDPHHLCTLLTRRLQMHFYTVHILIEGRRNTIARGLAPKSANGPSSVYPRPEKTLGTDSDWSEPISSATMPSGVSNGGIASAIARYAFSPSRPPDKASLGS